MPANCPTCQHTHANGRRCGSPALRHQQFCFYHHPTRRPPARPRPARAPFSIPPLIDGRSIQIALTEVAFRLADNTLDIGRARLMLFALRVAQANLNAANPADPGPDLPDLSGLMQMLSLQPNPHSAGL